MSLVAATATILLTAPRDTTHAASDTDCTVSRSSGWAAVGCYALRPGSPYRTAGLGGQAIGADGESLARIARCVAAGDHRSPDCTASLPGGTSPPPHSPSGLRVQPH